MAITISGDTPNFSAATITTITSTTLSDGTNSTSATNPIKGSAKAWVRFTGSTGTVASSYNVSSVTRTPTGLYTIAFTNAMSDANYCATVAISTTAATGYAVAFMFTNGSYVATAPTTTSFLLATVNNVATFIDPVYVNVSVFGN